MRTLVFNDGNSNKFWNITLSGTQYTVTFGKVGSKGQTQLKEFANADAAQKAHDKVVKEKLAKGYIETTPAPTPPLAAPLEVSPLQRSLESALIENPDDLATLSAYADFLSEQTDPFLAMKGEFMQIQLALEDASRPPQERSKLRKREEELLAAYAKDLLGDVGRFLVGDWSGGDKPWDFAFRRGCLDAVRISPFPIAVLRVLAKAPEASLLRQLEVVYDMRFHYDFGPDANGLIAACRPEEMPGDNEHIFQDEGILPAILSGETFRNLRIVRIGFSDNLPELRHTAMILPFESMTAQSMLELLARCPRLEELYLNDDIGNPAALFASEKLARLRVLQYFFACQWNSNRSDFLPLAVLADNPAIRNLTTLRFHGGREAELPLHEAVALLNSKNLPNLQHLMLGYHTFGDAIVEPLIDSGILRRLKSLRACEINASVKPSDQVIPRVFWDQTWCLTIKFTSSESYFRHTDRCRSPAAGGVRRSAKFADAGCVAQ